MEGTQAKMKLWIDAITKEKLHGIADEIEETFDSQVTEKENKALFKMLLYLSHTANKCDKSISATGFEMWRIGCCICSNLTDIPDANKFFSSIYHIASCLLEMRLYEEALEICDYILPSKLLKDASFSWEDMYSKVAYLLRNAASTLLKQSKLSSRKHFELFLSVIKYELNITKLAYRHGCWRYVLSKILSYCQKVGAFDNKSPQYSYDEFTNAMLTYISQQKISLDENNKEHTYKLIFSIITEMMLRNMKEKKNCSDARAEFTRYFDPFRNCLQSHESYFRCFNLYERLSMAFFRPITNVPQNIIKEIEACTCELRKIIMAYGYGEAIQWYSYSAALLFTDLLTYWHKSAKNATRNSSHVFIVSTINFLDEQCSIFDCYKINTCPCSEPKKCSTRYDVYNNVVLRLKALSLITRFLNIESTSGKGRNNEKKNNNNNVILDADETVDLTDICNLAVSFSQESETRIVAMKESGCTQWSLLWPTCGAHMYNLGVFCESKHQEKSVELYSMLSVSLVKLEGMNVVKGHSLLNLSNPMTSLLHRLTSVHLNTGKYEEATVVCALNGIISSKIINEYTEASECKAYKSWALIKKKYPPAREFTMLQCLRLNKLEIDRVIEIQEEDYDLINVCLWEIRILAGASRIDLSSSIIAVLDEMERLGAPAERYVQGVQFLGYHLLHFKSALSIDRYLRKATLKYKAAPLASKSLTCAYGHILFYEFCQALRDIGEKTENEIECAKSANTRATSPRNGESEPSAIDLQNVVPTYSTINIKVTTKIEASMVKGLRVWKDLFRPKSGYGDEFGDWEIKQVLNVAKIIGEYARLYLLESVEVEAWKLAYNLARDLQDHRSMIYITMRSLTSRYIDCSWIEEADKSVEILGKSEDSEIKETILGYRLSLADFYFQNGNTEAAEELFLAADSQRSESCMTDWANFYLAANLELNSFEDGKQDQSRYTRIIVISLYNILAIDDELEAPILSCKLNQLYLYDVIFEMTNNITHRMNSLYSWREIAAHLMRRLGTAQKLGAALRVAECLKCLCYIDLSRAKADDCEVKLQGLEHILEIEDFGLMMKNQMVIPSTCDRAFTSSSSCVVEAVRDVGQNNSSPVLRAKSFASPDFILHNKVCSCFKCTNSRYQSLVFAATHLRAQLFSLRRNSAAALQHFLGALQIKRNIMSRNSLTIRPAKNRLKCCAGSNVRTLDISRAYRHLEIVEYVFFHLDYCRFLKWSMPNSEGQGFEIALEALALCQKYNLKNHPVYASTRQLILDYRFDVAYNDADFSKFTVPSMDDMDADPEIQEPSKLDIICVTPARDITTQKAISVRRRKTPPFLNLEKVPIDLTEDEPSIAPSTPPRPRRTRRPRIIAEPQKDSNTLEVPSEGKNLTVPRISVAILIDDDEKTAEIDHPAGRRKTNKQPVEKIQSKLSVKNSQMENQGKASSSSRKVSQRGSASSRSNNSIPNTSTVAQISDVPPEIDDVVELLSELTVTKTVARSRLPLNAEKLVTMPPDETSTSGHEVAAANRRTSSRLRKKSQEVTHVDNRRASQSLEECASNSEDEVVIIGSRTKRLVTATTDKTTTAKESVKSSRSGRISKRTLLYHDADSNV